MDKLVFVSEIEKLLSSAIGMPMTSPGLGSCASLMESGRWIFIYLSIKFLLLLRVFSFSLVSFERVPEYIFILIEVVLIHLDVFFFSSFSWLCGWIVMLCPHSAVSIIIHRVIYT